MLSWTSKILAPEVCPTRDLDDPFAVEFVEAGIGVGLQEATEPGQVLGRPFAPAVGRVEEHRRRRADIGAWPVGADIDPQPAFLGAAAAGIEHRHRRVVGVHLDAGEDMRREPLAQRLQQPGGPADPVGERRAVEFDTLPCVDRRLPVERGMVRKLATSTCANSPGPGRPRSIGNDGIGVWCTLSHVRQAKRGRTWLFTSIVSRLVVENLRDSSPITAACKPDSAASSRAENGF